MINITDYILNKFPNKAPNASGSIHTQCPFHDDRSPSFSIDVITGLFICGSVRCGVRGNFTKFYRLMENCSWKQAYEDLKKTNTIFEISDLFEKKSLEYKKVFSNEFPQEPYVEDVKFVEYFEKRHLGKEVINTYGLKYGLFGEFSGINIADSIVAPVFDLGGIYRTFQVRYLQPYIKMRWGNPKESPIHNLLYGGWLISDRTKELFIVEGASDVWNMFNLGAQAVGLSTKEASTSQLLQIEKLCKFFGLVPIVCLDGDVRSKGKRHGLYFDEKLYFELSALKLNPKLVQLNLEEDPGSLTYERFLEIDRSI